MNKINHLDQVCYAKRVVLTEGAEEGVKAIFCYNGKLNFVLLESNGLDIYSLEHKGTNISCITKNGLFQGGNDFLQRFPAGMLYTCGFDNIGAGRNRPLHGLYHTLKAQIITCIANEEGIKVEGIIRQSQLFGLNLVMKRTIIAKLNAEEIEIHDELTNEAYKDEEYSILYHINVGYPMLDKDAEIVADIKSSYARTDFAKTGMDRMFNMDDATDNLEERCFFHDVKVPEVSLVNKKLGKKFTVTYSNKTLPSFVEWKSMASGDYALGLEPCSTTLDEDFKYAVIKGQETIKFDVKLSVKDI